MTFHHLVRDEMNDLDPRLLPLNDRFALFMLLQYWRGMAVIVHGRPKRFWRQAASKRSHPFFQHPLLPKYGGMLAQAAKVRALARCREKGFICPPFVFSFLALGAFYRLRRLELPHRPRLNQLALECASKVWAIPADRLDGRLADKMQPKIITPVHNLQTSAARNSMVGYGGVSPRGDTLMVVANARVWQALAHELVKGTAELICLHGLNRLGDETYRRVLAVADRLDLEPWMLQSGGELWRRLLQAMPDNLPVARVLMLLALLPAETLVFVIAAVIEQPESARSRLAELADETP